MRGDCKLYVDLLLNRALTIKSAALKAVREACELLVYEGKVLDHRVSACVHSSLQIQRHLEYHRLMRGGRGYRNAAMAVDNALTITVVLPEELYTSGALAVCSELTCQSADTKFSIVQTANHWIEELAYTGSSYYFGLMHLCHP